MTRTDAALSVEEAPGAVGEHLLLDLYGVAPALLRDAAALEKALRDAASALGATILHAHLHRFDWADSRNWSGVYSEVQIAVLK